MLAPTVLLASLVPSTAQNPASLAATADSVVSSSASRSAAPESPALTSLGAANRYQGIVVREITFRGISQEAKALHGFRELVSQETGLPMDRLKVRQSILALYGTGRFASIEAQAEGVSGDSFALVFVAKPNYFIGPVSVDGVPKHPNENQLVTATKLQLGELFTREKLDRAIVNIKSVLAENGFYQAAVTHRSSTTQRRNW